MNEGAIEKDTEDKLDFIIRPSIYSKQAVFGFSFLMTPVYGGVLLMMNLKTIEKRKEATIAFIVSLLMTLAIFILAFYLDDHSRSITFFLNLVSASVLTEFLYKKYIPDAAEYPKKKTWLPLVIALAIVIFFMLLGFLAQDLLV